jgi:amino acid transporter
MDTAWRVLTRKKILDPVTTEQSELGRVLNTVDLTALGVGSTLGVGVYVLAGHVAKDTAGPAVVISFLIATIASVFAGLCYAEFGARTPRAGSAYIYSYVCVGEFVAFVIGWNLILEYVIGSASVARGLSLYLDTLINDTLKDTFRDIAPLGDVDFLSKYFDFFAFGVSLILAVALAFGLKESSWVNNIFTLLNLAVVAFVIVAGGMNAKGENWRLPANASNPDDHGGFMPFGVEGMIKGAATCFYGFVGFDCIATTGEEVKNPKKAIPVAIVLSLFIIFLAYFGTSTVVTLMLPYYDQVCTVPFLLSGFVLFLSLGPKRSSASCLRDGRLAHSQVDRRYRRYFRSLC